MSVHRSLSDDIVWILRNLKKHFLIDAVTISTNGKNFPDEKNFAMQTDLTSSMRYGSHTVNSGWRLAQAKLSFHNTISRSVKVVLVNGFIEIPPLTISLR
jgi:hypothetical protein